MKARGLFSAVNDEVGEIIVADVASDAVKDLVQPDSPAREKLITKV